MLRLSQTFYFSLLEHIFFFTPVFRTTSRQFTVSSYFFMPVPYWLCKVPLQRSAWQCHLNKYILNNNNNNCKAHLFQSAFNSPSDLSSASDSFYWMIMVLNQILLLTYLLTSTCWLVVGSLSFVTSWLSSMLHVQAIRVSSTAFYRFCITRRRSSTTWAFSATKWKPRSRTITRSGISQ